MRKNKMLTLNRREFIKGSVIGLASLPSLSFNPLMAKATSKKAKIALVKTQDRKEGVQKVLELLDFASVDGKKVMLKPNFNTADPAPGSTHNDTLSQLVKSFKRGELRRLHSAKGAVHPPPRVY